MNSNILILIILINLTIIITKTINQSNNKISNVAIPRSKSSNNKSINKLFNNKLFNQLVRTIKTSFSSDLEGLTLELTNPNDELINNKILNDLIVLIDNEYENPELLVSLLAKLSRKLFEDNIYSKLKVILSIHLLFNYCNDKAKSAISICIQTLLTEYDSKVANEFYSYDSIESFSSIASTVGELEILELTREYYKYTINNYILLYNKKNKSTSDELIDLYLSVLQQSIIIEDLCKKSLFKLPKKIFELIKSDRSFVIKSLNKLYNEVDISDKTIEKNVETILQKLDNKFIVKSKVVIEDIPVKAVEPEDKPIDNQPIKNKVDSKNYIKIDSKIDSKLTKEVDSKVDKKDDSKQDKTVDIKLDSKVDKKENNKIDSKIDKKVESNIEHKVDNKFDKKVDSKLASKVTSKIGNNPKTTSPVESTIKKSKAKKSTSKSNKNSSQSKSKK